jgi:hypothetical protein
MKVKPVVCDQPEYLQFPFTEFTAVRHKQELCKIFSDNAKQNLEPRNRLGKRHYS